MIVLAPGHHLYPGRDGVWRYSAPADRFVRITGDPSVLAAFQRSAHGRTDADEIVLDDDQRDALTRLRNLFAERGLLDSPSTPATEAEVARPTICVEGANPLAATVAGLLDGSAQVLRDPVDEGVVDTADVVISCAGWLPDAHWQQVDTWCASRKVAWHRVHADGLDFFLGPMTVPGLTASYRDLRGRRLAASGVADELRAHWAYLDDPTQTPPPVPWPNRAGLAVLAGLLVHDVQAYLRTGTPARIDTQLEVDVATGRVGHHPVLPLPVTATR